MVLEHAQELLVLACGAGLVSTRCLHHGAVVQKPDPPPPPPPDPQQVRSHNTPAKGLRGLRGDRSEANALEGQKGGIEPLPIPSFIGLYCPIIASMPHCIASMQPADVAPYPYAPPTLLSSCRVFDSFSCGTQFLPFYWSQLIFKGVKAARAKMPSKKAVHLECYCECRQTLTNATDDNIKAHQQGKAHIAALARKATGQPQKMVSPQLFVRTRVRVCVCVWPVTEANPTFSSGPAH